MSGPETAESLLAVLQPDLDPAIVETARKQKLSLKFLSYDWSLNISLPAPVARQAGRER